MIYIFNTLITPCCEPTYKELKHQEIFLILATPLGCEPTYKELKQKCPICGKGKLISCEPTYKELKPASTTTFCNFPDVRCEPTYKELKLDPEDLFRRMFT